MRQIMKNEEELGKLRLNEQLMRIEHLRVKHELEIRKANAELAELLLQKEKTL